MPPQKDFYEILGLKKGASHKEIRRAYHKTARRLHPDTNKRFGETELFLEVQKAFEVLSDPKLRAQYDQQYIVEEDQGPLLAKILYSRSSIPIIEEPQLIYALLDFFPGNGEGLQTRLPVNICLVLDRSTSMQGERMDTVKEAAVRLIRSLQPLDKLSIVTFSDRAELLVSREGSAGRLMLENQIRMLRPGGGTEIHQGLQLGYEQVHRHSHDSFLNIIQLITDGRTYGDENACLQLASSAAQNGIHITCFGIGSEWNDVFLDDLASRTGGSTTFISKSDTILTSLEEQFNSFCQSFASQVTLDFECGPYVSMNTVFRIQPEVAIMPTTTPIHLGTIPDSSKLSLLFEFTISPLPAEIRTVDLTKGDLKMMLLYSNPEPHKIPVELTCPIGGASDYQIPPPPIFLAISRLNLYRMQDIARTEVTEGKVMQASLRLQRLASHLLSIGEHDLGQTAMMESERIRNTHILSAEGEKKIKYGTRALLLPQNSGGN